MHGGYADAPGNGPSSVRIVVGEGDLVVESGRFQLPFKPVITFKTVCSICPWKIFNYYLRTFEGTNERTKVPSEGIY